MAFASSLENMSGEDSMMFRASMAAAAIMGGTEAEKQ